MSAVAPAWFAADLDRLIRPITRPERVSLVRVHREKAQEGVMSREALWHDLLVAFADGMQYHEWYEFERIADRVCRTLGIDASEFGAPKVSNIVIVNVDSFIAWLRQRHGRGERLTEDDSIVAHAIAVWIVCQSEPAGPPDSRTVDRVLEALNLFLARSQGNLYKRVGWTVVTESSFANDPRMDAVWRGLVALADEGELAALEARRFLGEIRSLDPQATASNEDAITRIRDWLTANAAVLDEIEDVVGRAQTGVAARGHGLALMQILHELGWRLELRDSLSDAQKYLWQAANLGEKLSPNLSVTVRASMPRV